MFKVYNPLQTLKSIIQNITLEKQPIPVNINNVINTGQVVLPPNTSEIRSVFYRFINDFTVNFQTITLIFPDNPQVGDIYYIGCINKSFGLYFDGGAQTQFRFLTGTSLSPIVTSNMLFDGRDNMIIKFIYDGTKFICDAKLFHSSP